MEIKKRLGKRIQELRIKNNLTQSELAEKVGIATKSQSCIETGKNYPTAENMEKYAKAFNIDISELLEISHVKPKDEILDDLINILKTVDTQNLTTIYKIVKGIIN